MARSISSRGRGPCEAGAADLRANQRGGGRSLWLSARGAIPRFSPLAHLLAPHRVIQPLRFDELLVPSRLRDAAALEDVDAIGVHNGGQTMRDHHGDHVAR